MKVRSALSLACCMWLAAGAMAQTPPAATSPAGRSGVDHARDQVAADKAAIQADKDKLKADKDKLKEDTRRLREEESRERQDERRKRQDAVKERAREGGPAMPPVK